MARRRQADRMGYQVKYVPHEVTADYNATYNVMHRGQHIFTNAAKRLRIPLNEIWISEMWRPYEKYILHHELREIQYRAQGLSAGKAHMKTCEDEYARWKDDALWQRMVGEIQKMDQITARRGSKDQMKHNEKNTENLRQCFKKLGIVQRSLRDDQCSKSASRNV